MARPVYAAWLTHLQFKLIALSLALRCGRHGEVTVIVLCWLRIGAAQQLIVVHVQERERRARRIRVHAHNGCCIVNARVYVSMCV